MVLARRTDVRFTGRLDALALLATLQERDPRSYQAFLQARPLLFSALTALQVT